MPDDSKKHQQKPKHEAKEQRKPRLSRNKPSVDKKMEKKVEEPKVPVPPQAVYEDPGPEFYNGLKRETDEILKITEEANSKYKKKEIQSNWSKYEMPIDTYEEMEEQENLGADYEKIIQAPQSIGGHFRFKHEKTWDISTAPSLYDKYFDINMENLATALSTIPFYERNGIEKTIFSDIDVLNMENRATRYKQKYYNDKSYTTPELDAHDNILQKLKGSLSKDDEKRDDISNLIENKQLETKDVVLEEVSKTNENETGVEIQLVESKNFVENTKLEVQKDPILNEKLNNVVKSQIIDDIDDVIFDNDDNKASLVINLTKEIEHAPGKKEVQKVAETSNESKPVIDSPEDLEKWLDDFLDG